MSVIDVRAVPTKLGRQLLRDVAQGVLPGGALASALRSTYFMVGEKGYLTQPGGAQIPKNPDNTGLGYSSLTGLEATDVFAGTVGNRTFTKSLLSTSSAPVATFNSPAPTAGERRLATSAGTVTPGSVAVAVNDILEYDADSLVWQPGLTRSGDFTLVFGCILQKTEANAGTSLSLFEIGLFIPPIALYSVNPIMLCYGTFPEETKTNLVKLTHNVRVTF